ncbi:MAG: hypothetical protein LBE91_03445 [Tannerella sp.]|jgi:hypothetical protein|nr:hypothetical protein [Tannerella sp.]
MTTTNFKNRFFGTIILLLATGLLFNSCSKDRDDDTNPKIEQTDVYVAGFEVVDGQHVATLWKNGVATRLGNGVDESGSFSVAVSGNDVYVAGSELKEGGKRIAKLWKNGVATNLTDGTNSANAYTVFVSGSDVYVGGYEIIGVTDRGKIWKNGKLYWTAPQNTFREINSIYVKGTDVYVAGYIGSGTQFYWINPNALVPTVVNVPELDNITSIVVSGSDVYVGGNKGKIARYMKNSKVVNLTDESNDAHCYSIFVSGNDVYAAGTENNGSKNIAKLWKNSTTLYDGAEYSNVESVYGWNDKVYAAINTGEIAPCYVWEDGKLTKLTDKGYISSIFVVEKK